MRLNSQIMHKFVLTILLSAVFAVLPITAVNAATAAQKPVAAARFEPFDLNKVRLLDGPFKHATELNRDYLLKLEPDRFLAWFRKEAGLPAKAQVYAGWESRGIAGHSLGHYLSACALLYRATNDRRLLDKINYIVDELHAVQTANGDGYVAAIPEGKRIFAEIRRGEIRSQGFDLNGGWVPFYTLHKEFAGLRDAYRLAGNQKALGVAVKLADWLDGLLANINHDQMQQILRAEHGGMNEVLADLAIDAKDARYMRLSARFYHEAVLDPLAAGQDVLPGLHANTQIPKIIGLARRHELTDDAKESRTAEFFWQRVAEHQSYVTGGNGLNEHFGPADKLNDRLGAHTTETCNVYNMLKLTGKLISLDARAKLGDFYERALFNHILSSQHPVDGRVIYDLTLAQGGRKHYETQFESFTCCVGTGMENHAKYGSDIYFHTADSLLVNLFIASELDWREKNLKITQETRFPDEDTTRFLVTAKNPTKLKMLIRRPYWATAGATLKINGKTQKYETAPGSYFEIERTWRTGDRVELVLPQKLYLEAMPDNPNRVAVKYGAIVLAGDLGAADNSAEKSNLNSSANSAAGVADAALDLPALVPVLIDADKTDLSKWLKPVAGEPLTFQTVGVGKPADFVLKPFFRTHDRRYSVYWDIFTPAQWTARAAAYKAEVERVRDLAARTVDLFQPGEMQSERDHEFRGEKVETGDFGEYKWRHARDGGWFSVTMKIVSDKPQDLQIKYWGGDAGNRSFDILVDNEKIAAQKLEANRPGKFYDETYQLPPSLTAGKNKITVRFQADAGKTAGGIYGVRVVRR